MKTVKAFERFIRKPVEKGLEDFEIRTLNEDILLLLNNTKLVYRRPLNINMEIKFGSIMYK